MVCMLRPMYWAQAAMDLAGVPAKESLTYD